MARNLRIESAGASYHVLTRGNSRADVFSSEGAKRAFLKCLGEACAKTGWKVHAWCMMTNHYHLAIETPEPNLVEGMQWFQGTFAARFNRFRREHGHIFQGRYKALVVEAGAALGALCHYIHLNPVRAGILDVEQLGLWPWSSYRWLQHPDKRADWFRPGPALESAGSLADTPAGRNCYQDYLRWLSAETIAQQHLGFDRMSRGWALGSQDFKQELMHEEKRRRAALSLGTTETLEARELAWTDEIQRLKALLPRVNDGTNSKSADWKVAIATHMKDVTTASNRWLAEHLEMGSLFTVSRLTAECRAGLRATAAYQRLTARSKP